MATRETVTIEVEVEGDGFRRLASESKSLKKSLSAVDKENRNASEGFADTAELADKMRGALGPLGDVLGDATGFLADTTDALGSFKAGQVAATAVVLAGVAGFLKFAGAIAETIVSIDDMAEALRERGDPELNASVASVEKLNEKLTELGVTYDAQWVIITSRFAPALGGLVEVADTALPAFSKLVNAGITLAEQMSSTAASVQLIGTALGVVDVMSDKADMVDRLGYSITELDENFVSLMDEFGQFGQSEELPLYLHLVSDASKDVKEALKASAKAAKEAKRELRGLAKAEKDASAAATESTSKYLDTALALDSVTETATVGGDAFNQLAAEATSSGETTKKTVQELAQNAQGTLDPFLSGVSSVTSSIADLYNQVTNDQISNMKRGSAEQKKALKQQFAVNKAMALVNATIQTAQAVLQALASTPYPASIAFAALAGAAGAAQIAMIAAQKPPSFHRGGLMPDERTAFGGRAITRSNEAEVVITAQGQQTFADTINALNRGEHSRGGGITVMLDSAPIRNVVYGLGQADPAYGHRVRQ